MEKNPDITKPHYAEDILPVPWPFITLGFHSSQERLPTNHDRSPLCLKMMKQITSFAAHFCSWTHKHDFWCDTKEMFQAHADLKRPNPLAWSNKLSTFILEINKSLLDFFMTWNRFGCVTLVTKPGSYGLKWAIGTTPPLRETKNKILWGATKNLKICKYKTVKWMIKEKLGMVGKK